MKFPEMTIVTKIFGHLVRWYQTLRVVGYISSTTPLTKERNRNKRKGCNAVLILVSYLFGALSQDFWEETLAIRWQRKEFAHRKDGVNEKKKDKGIIPHKGSAGQIC